MSPELAPGSRHHAPTLDPRWTHAGPTRDRRGDVIRPSSFVPNHPARLRGERRAQDHTAARPLVTRPIPVLAFGIWFQFGANARLQTGIQRDAASSLSPGFVGGYVVLRAAASILGGICNQ